jgi:hypothetical protein
MPLPGGLVALEVVDPGKGPAKEYFYTENLPVEPEPELEPESPPDEIERLFN